MEVLVQKMIDNYGLGLTCALFLVGFVIIFLTRLFFYNKKNKALYKLIQSQEEQIKYLANEVKELKLERLLRDGYKIGVARQILGITKKKDKD